MALTNQICTAAEVVVDTPLNLAKSRTGSKYYQYLLGLSAWDALGPEQATAQLSALRPLLSPFGFVVHIADMGAPPEMVRHMVAHYPDRLLIPYLSKQKSRMEVRCRGPLAWRWR